MKKILFSLAVLAGISATAQVKVGDNPTTIDANSVLELESTNKGLLLPRVALTSTGDAAPLSAHVAGMTVYNTATAGSGTTAVSPGEYYNDGTQWLKKLSASTSIAPTKYVYVDTADPNTATKFDDVNYWSYDYQTTACSVNTAYVHDATLAQNKDYLYIGQSTCDADNDMSEFSFWIWNGTNYVTAATPDSTAWNLSATQLDAGSTKTESIQRKGNVIIGDIMRPYINYDERQLNAKLLVTAYNQTALANQGNVMGSFIHLMTPSRTANGTTTTYGIYAGTSGEVNSGINTTGSIVGGTFFGMRRYGDNGGNLSSIRGIRSLYGHSDFTNQTGVTGQIVGLELIPQAQFGTITQSIDILGSNISTTHDSKVSYAYGLMMMDSKKNNVIEGDLKIGTFLGNGTNEKSAALEISSSEKGVLMPRLSSLNLNDIVSPTAGLMVYNTDVNCMMYYDGTQWKCTDGTGAVTPTTPSSRGSQFTTFYNGIDNFSIYPTAKAVIGGGVITQISVTNEGSGFTDVPFVVITGGGGTGATATATLTSGKVTSITIDNAGSGYTSVPTVTIYPKYNGTNTTIDHSALTTSEPFSENALCSNKPISKTSCGGSTTLTVGANTYNIVEINGQCWFAQNLKEVPSKYTDTPNTGKNVWINTNATAAPDSDYGKWGYYNTATTNGSAGWATTESTSLPGAGLLYQWKAAMNGSTVERAQGACPTGWHIPSDCEWMYLEHGLGLTVRSQIALNARDNNVTGLAEVGNKIKSEGANSNNASGFTGKMGGYRSNTNGSFAVATTTSTGSSIYWTSSFNQATTAFTRVFSVANNGAGRVAYGRELGASVRCLKN